MNFLKSFYSLILSACLVGAMFAENPEVGVIDDLALKLRFQKGLEGLHENEKGLP